jgi:tetratricopeptide (TPR) repeat protein
MNLNRNTVQGKAVWIFMALFILMAAIATGVAYFSLKARTSYEKVNKENVEFKNNFDKIKNEFAKLQKDYQAVFQDRENLLIQVKKMIVDKNLAEELKISLEESKKLISQLEEDKAKAAQESSKFEEESNNLKTTQQQLVQEKQQLEQALEDLRVKYSTQAWQQEKIILQKENNELKNNLKQAQAQVTKLNDGSWKLSKELEKSRKESAQFYSKSEKINKDYAAVMQKTKAVERRIEEAPEKFAELARQNKALIKQTANMHYNLGVFYTKNKQYSRAIAEFEKAVELNPEDSHAHFNLGYIYAQYLENRARAVEHFRKYLNLADSSDKDIDWVKKYIITWTSYEAKQPLK